VAVIVRFLSALAAYLVGTMAAHCRIRVELVYDEGSRNWGFAVETPSVVGGGDATLDEAMRHASEAIAFALETEVKPATDRLKGRVEYLPIRIG
jgi:predicted RNase H-like HicB family nuclease